MTTAHLTPEEALEQILLCRSPAAKYWKLGRAIMVAANRPEDARHIARGDDCVAEWAQAAAKDMILANLERCPHYPAAPRNPGLAEPQYRYVLAKSLGDHVRPMYEAAAAADPHWRRLRDAMNEARDDRRAGRADHDGIPPSLRAFTDYDEKVQNDAGYLELYALQLHAEARLVRWAKEACRNFYGARFAAIEAGFVPPCTLRPELRHRLIDICLGLPKAVADAGPRPPGPQRRRRPG